MNSKHETWVGSNLLRRPLAADSCDSEDGLWVSKILLKPSIEDEDDDDSGTKRSIIRIYNLVLNMV